MLTIRLARVGKKNQPSYRIVVIDHRKATDGSFLEIIGFYNPLTDPATVEIKKERVEYWLGKGAKVSTTVSRFVKNIGITLDKSQIRKKRRRSRKKEKKEEGKEEKKEEVAKKPEATKEAGKPKEKETTKEKEETPKKPAEETAKPEKREEAGDKEEKKETKKEEKKPKKPEKEPKSA